MTTKEAQQLVQKTFQNPFDKGQFVYFIKNLVNEIDESKAFHARGYVHEKYRDKVKTYERIGSYTDPDDNKIDILVVYLQKESSIDRARTTLRNFVGDYLKERGEKEAGLIAFVSPNQKDWRFSLVKMEYKITETPSGRVKAKEEFTPAKRYSFLVGVEETSHTAQSRLVPILEDDANNPTLKQIEEAFNIEKVTKEFFEKYRDLYLWVKETLDEVLKNDKAIKADFAGKNIDTVDFGKKLLGQIVFLYFLQKKGWFGVKRGEAWGSGSKNFLRELFDKKHGDYKNFFNDILEPLFYEALRNDRSHDDHYFSMFKCKIPFLNGGLFDPINNYDWKETDIILPNDLFSNSYKTKEGDIGTGILDIFDRYNFTVKEDEPLEKEVAVDPEMLGKVFENLLEVKDRKSKGTYYTPREIVHYMCQESLVNYLATELEGKVNKKDIETLIKYGEAAVEHDATSVEKKSKDPKYKSSYYKPKLPKSIEKHAKLIDEKLETIRICDPAVGSGAFPVGMMNEIIRTRNALTSYLKIKKGRTIYDFKRHAIQNCLYGVDIDLGAVEIAKLRLWLSLIVDEEDIKQIKPLPNLDYKIVQGNSLSSVEQNLFNQPLFSKLEELKPLFFNETNARKKQEYKMQIDELIRQITNNNQSFDFKIYFSEVFHDHGGEGFDVVIANPPYISLEKVDIATKSFLQKHSQVYAGKADILYFFFEKGIVLLSKNGVLAFITSRYYIEATYAQKLRQFIIEHCYVNKLVDFHNHPVFQSVGIHSLVTILSRNTSNQDTMVAVLRSSVDNISFYDDFEVFNLKLSNSDWSLIPKKDKNIFEKIKNNSELLGDIAVIEQGQKTGYNEAFVVSKEIARTLEKEPLRKLIKNSHIHKYFVSFKDLYLIYTDDSFVIDKFPKIKQHLSKYKNELRARAEAKNDLYAWYRLQRPRDPKLFEAEFKIVVPYRAEHNKFAYDDQKYFNDGGDIRIIVLKSPSESFYKYCLALLNSKVINYYFRFIGRRKGNMYEYFRDSLEKIPIKQAPQNEQKSLVDIVDKILAVTKNDDYLENSAKQAKVRDYEKQIDQLVYKLYGLTPEEIRVVEES